MISVTVLSFLLAVTAVEVVLVLLGELVWLERRLRMPSISCSYIIIERERAEKIERERGEERINREQEDYKW